MVEPFRLFDIFSDSSIEVLKDTFPSQSHFHITQLKFLGVTTNTGRQHMFLTFHENEIKGCFDFRKIISLQL